MPRFVLRVLPAAAVAAALLASLVPALAADAPTPNKGDTAWMLVSAALVLLMTIPGLALFYAGLVRAKNVVSMLTQVLAIVCLVALIWVIYGYSLAFTGGPLNSFVGGFSKAFLWGVGPEATTGTFSNGVVIPELVFVCFQMTFACITPALIVGGFAERMKFSALLLFVALWVTFVYFPMAHMVWYWAGPDAVGDAAKAVAAATDAAAKTAAQAKLDEVLADGGLIFSWGALDFAGGTVVHINSGIAALVGAIMLGKRIGYQDGPIPPHSLTLTMVGAALLWVGWFGFNAGSALEAGGSAALAMANTFVATAAAALTWAIVEFIFKWKFSLLGLASGSVAGLVAVTPAAGFSGVMGAIALGAAAGLVCLLFCTAIKSALKYDDSLDVFGIHCVGGIVGAIGTGLLVNPEWGGVGLADYVTKPGELAVGTYDMATQVIAQTKGVVLTLVWSGIGSYVIFKIVDALIGARVEAEVETTGLDLGTHGERAYVYES